MTYLLATRLDEALEMAADPGTVVVAGGTDFYPARVGRPLTEPILDISGLTELRGITAETDHHRFGALTSWTEIRTAALPDGLRSLQLAAAEVGGIQVQNVGTIGGNLCNSSPAADGIPPLLALNASIELASVQGRRVVTLEDFLIDYRKTALEPGELLTAVLIPRDADEARSTFLKLGSRRYLVISIAMVAATIVADGAGAVGSARIAVGACSPVARRLTALEEALHGLPVGPGLAGVVDAGHFGVLAPIDDPRAGAAYRLDAAATLVRRALEQLGAGQ